MDTLKKLLKLFDRRQKQHLIMLFFLMLVGAGLEVLSVSMMVPAAAVMLQGEEGSAGKLYTLMHRLFPASSQQDFIISVLVMLIVVTVLKGLFLILEKRIQFHFIYSNRFSLQRKMLHAFLSRPYEYYLGAETGEVLRVIQNDVAVTFNLAMMYLEMATELVIVSLLMVTVFVISPMITGMTAFFMLLTVLVITKILKPIQKEHGTRRNRLTAQTNKWLIQSISGIREIKISRKERYFENNYLTYGKETILIDRDQAVLGAIPRYLIEITSVSATLAVIAFQVRRGISPEVLLPELSAFVMAAVKLLPSTNKIATTINAVSYFTNSLNKVVENLGIISGTEQTELADDSAERMPFESCIEFRDITFRYPNTDTDTLEDASLTIPQGACIGIVGPSGAGKTTAVDVMIGLLTPQKGQTLLDGVDIRTNYAGWLAHIGYIPQMIFMLDDTIRANVAFGIGEDEQSEERIWQSLEDAQLADFVRTLPQGLDTRIGERGIRLSGGQRQRIGIARALYGNPDILIFDEATSSLDNDTEKAIMRSILRLKGKKTMIIIAHRLTTIETCDAVYEVRDRKILEKRIGHPKEGASA